MLHQGGEYSFLNGALVFEFTSMRGPSVGSFPEKSNRYSYRGKIPDWEELQKERARIHIPEESTRNNLDFIAFKQMQEEQEK